MLLHRPFSAMPARLWRALASLTAGLVMLLSLSAVSPELHAWLHAKEKVQKPHACAHHATQPTADDASHAPSSNADDGATHECAVTMFSHGIVHQAIALLAQPCEGILRAVNSRAFERLALAQPRYWHLPPQAPPLSLS
jgi:hypothetical protein